MGADYVVAGQRTKPALKESLKKTITLQPSGHSFMSGDCENVLLGALRSGFALPHSCRGGSCRSCLARVIDGHIRYPNGPPIGLMPEDEQGGYVLLCQAEALSDLEVEIRELEIGDGTRPKRLPCRVQRMEKLAPDVIALFLKLPSVEPFRFSAGQYLDFLLRDGRRRSFSIASPPHDSELIEVHVRHVPDGAFTNWVFEKCAEKSLLRVEGPLGAFVLDESAKRPMLFVAGGTGFAPIKGMLRHAFRTGMKRPMHLFWGARSEIDLYEHQLVSQWHEERSMFRYTPVLSEAGESGWGGQRGWVHEAVVSEYPDLSEYMVYMSGPPPMIEAARRDFAAAGLPKDQLHFDSFEFAVDPRRLHAPL